MNRVLLIFHNVPEDVYLYALELSDEDYARVVKCRMHFGDSAALAEAPQDVQDAVDWLGDRVFNDPEWQKFKLDPATCGHASGEIVLSGWLM